ncbi:MAG: tetratricopeptide repeat protein [Verrucomicrobiota bacterium]
MNAARSASRLAGLVALVLTAGLALSQSPPEVRRAVPVDERPAPRAQLAPGQPQISPTESEKPSAAAGEAEAPDRRQLEYAKALYLRKLYDLAIPEFEKYLEQYVGAPGRASACFFLGESYRALNRNTAARKSFQQVLDDYGESEFAGPAAYVLAETAFTQKNYGEALPLFHRAAFKSKESAVALSAKYFEARCLETLDRKDDAAGIYQQVIDAKGPNPYREDSRLAAASIFISRGKKTEALKQYEALATEAQKPAAKAEAAVRGGMIALDLIQSDKSKVDKGMLEKATTLLQKGRASADAGKLRAIAQVGFRRLQYQTGQYEKLLEEYKKELSKLPEAGQAEVTLLAANSERQLGHAEEADEIYRKIISEFPDREEARDAAYQRLINLYNSDPSALLAEVDDFLESNPTAERADQAKLLKAEALYKEQKHAEAAPIYSELREAQLTPKLRAECAYKLGVCYVQTKNVSGAIEAFGYFLQAFPDSPQASAALAQRALAYQQDKNYNSALADLNAILTKYPKAHEREAALQTKALILGQQDDPKGMAQTFRQLLKEFPKSSVAAQAQYYIGKGLFDEKDYKGAIAPLEKARQLNNEQYHDQASLRIILSHFYLKDRAALTTEVNNFMEASPGTNVPPEVLEGLGIEYYNEKNYAAAEKYLSALGKIDNPGNVKPDFWFYLGDAASRQKNFGQAEEAFAKYLQTATDAAGKAKVLLALGAAKIGAHKPDDAQKIAEQIMTLQPEGRVNAEARLLAGEVQIERGHFDEAGKAFMGVALLYDDPAITPRALEKAASAYRRAGKTDEADRVNRQLHERYPNHATDNS